MGKHSASILGATGIAGGEIVRLLLDHPNINITHCFAATSAGTKISEHHPNLTALRETEVKKFDINCALESDVIFICLPHGASHEYTALLEEHNYRGVIIDIGADHRLENEADWNEFYADGGKFSAPYVYGLPELMRLDNRNRQRESLLGAKRIAVAGCNVTAVTLGLQPLFANNAVKLDKLVAVLANGYSGAGKTLKPHLLAVNAFENAKPYAVGGVHRHIPEIRQNLMKAGGLKNSSDVKISFTPTLVPLYRGILAIISAEFSTQITNDELQKMFTDFYSNEQFVNVLRDGDLPQTSAVSMQNYADISVKVDKITGNALIIVAIDNLVRGTAGTAIQCMNLALGFSESTGLLSSGGE